MVRSNNPAHLPSVISRAVAWIIGREQRFERAMEIARKMVCEWGMCELGPMSFGKKRNQIFLGREISQHRGYSEETAIRIDAEVQRIVTSAYDGPVASSLAGIARPGNP